MCLPWNSRTRGKACSRGSAGRETIREAGTGQDTEDRENPQVHARRTMPGGARVRTA